MNPDFPCRFLIWSLAVNYTILLAWFFAFAFARGFMRKIHGRWFKLSDQTFSGGSCKTPTPQRLTACGRDVLSANHPTARRGRA